jgi:hypothetical protein
MRACKESKNATVIKSNCVDITSSKREARKEEMETSSL